MAANVTISHPCTSFTYQKVSSWLQCHQSVFALENILRLWISFSLSHHSYWVLLTHSTADKASQMWVAGSLLITDPWVMGCCRKTILSSLTSGGFSERRLQRWMIVDNRKLLMIWSGWILYHFGSSRWNDPWSAHLKSYSIGPWGCCASCMLLLG